MANNIHDPEGRLQSDPLDLSRRGGSENAGKEQQSSESLLVVDESPENAGDVSGPFNCTVCGQVFNQQDRYMTIP